MRLIKSCVSWLTAQILQNMNPLQILFGKWFNTRSMHKRMMKIKLISHSPWGIFYKSDTGFKRINLRVDKMTSCSLRNNKRLIKARWKHWKLGESLCYPFIKEFPHTSYSMAIDQIASNDVYKDTERLNIEADRSTTIFQNVGWTNHYTKKKITRCWSTRVRVLMCHHLKWGEPWPN